MSNLPAIPSLNDRQAWQLIDQAVFDPDVRMRFQKI